MIDVELSAPVQIEQLARRARDRNWGLSFLLAGWLHLLCFGLCSHLSVSRAYHDAAGYLIIWLGELLGMALIFRLCGGRRSPEAPRPLERFVVRVWISYFLLAFNLGSLNTLRGHAMFELFPAMASLASFAFLIMTFAVDRRFFAAVLVMFVAGLLMAAHLLYSYLTFGLAWWLVLNGLGVRLWLERSASTIARGEAFSTTPPRADAERTLSAGQAPGITHERQPHHRSA
jgi:hypothetical protein